MKNKLSLSPKVKNKVTVKRTLVYASVGASIFVMIFTGAFFYLNMGNNEEALAATVKIAKTGNWSDPKTWLPLGQPVSGEDIVIPEGVTVTITTNLSILDPTSIRLNGTLIFDNGKLNLGSSSIILIGQNGNIPNPPGNGNNDRIQIGDHTWSRKGNGKNSSTFSSIKYPSTLTSGGEAPYILPIVLDYFTAEVTASNSVLVEWGTVSEKENDFFTLERSSDGRTFETIATVEGAGNSLKKLQYSYEDNKSTVGMNYYRLKQTDYNGDFEYFKIVGVNNTIGSGQESTIEGNAPLIISDAYPNPFANEVNLSFEAEMDGNVEIMIQNSRGEIVHKEMFSFYYGINDYKFAKGDQLQPGIYYINVWNNGKKLKPQRLIKI